MERLSQPPKSSNHLKEHEVSQSSVVKVFILILCIVVALPKFLHAHAETAPKSVLHSLDEFSSRISRRSLRSHNQTFPRSGNDPPLFVATKRKGTHNDSLIARKSAKSEQVQHPGKTSVVMMTRTLSACIVDRISAVHNTSGFAETWLLLNDVSKEDTSVVSRLTKMGIRLDNQPHPGKNLHNFGGERSGKTKPAFLMWLMEHPDVPYAWHLEDDVIFTGEWASVLADSRWADADIVAADISMEKDSSWARHFGKQCKVAGRSCLQNSKVPLMKLKWHAIRMSRKLAVELHNSIKMGRTVGHHEIVTGEFCKLTKMWNCTYAGLKKEEIGKYESAGWGKLICSGTAPCDMPSYATILRSPEMQNKLHHPIKCHLHKLSPKR